MYYHLQLWCAITLGMLLPARFLHCSQSHVIPLHDEPTNHKICGPPGLTPPPLGSRIGPHKPGLMINRTNVVKQRLSAAHRWLQRQPRSKLLSISECYETDKFVFPRTMGHIEPLAHVESVIALHFGHDPTIAISKNGRVQCVLEWERLFGIRHFSIGETISSPCLGNYLLVALEVVRDRCECEGKCPRRFRHGVVTSTPVPCVLDQVRKVFYVQEWRTVLHHEAHASHAFHASPFRSALVVIYDGGSDDGTFNAFLGIAAELYHVARFRLNYGVAYVHLAPLLREVSGFPVQDACDDHWFPGITKTQHALLMKYYARQRNVTEWWELHVDRDAVARLSDAGKLMGYAATGKNLPEIQAAVRTYLKRKFRHGGSRVPIEIVFAACAGLENQRAIAASIQSEFERFALAEIRKLLESMNKFVQVEGIVISGGCALNVPVNQLVRDALTRATSDSKVERERATVDDVYVPPGPNDSGIAIGALWAVDPPSVRQPLQYLGFRLWDEYKLALEARRRNATKLSTLGGVEYLADLLAGNGTSQRPIIGVVRGRQEFGPRALGHRSLLASPDSDDIRNRLNRLKQRQWYRPVAPMIADEALAEVFGQAQKSTSMEMAPRVRKAVRERFPALAHLDGTARHQSVGKEDEPWLHALLIAVGQRTGLGALINTSFNSRGKPICNTVFDALEMLDTLADLDYVLIEDWLFQASAKKNVEGQFDIYSMPAVDKWEVLQ